MNRLIAAALMQNLGWLIIMLAQYNSTDENIVNGKIAEHANESC